MAACRRASSAPPGETDLSRRRQWPEPRPTPHARPPGVPTPPRPRRVHSGPDPLRASSRGEAGGSRAAGVGAWRCRARLRGWYERAAEAGDTVAMWRLARLFFDGDFDGGKQDDERARYWYGKAADAGDAEAMTRLVSFLSDRTEKMLWLRRAAELGEADAAQQLGLMLLDEQRLVEGERWLRQAAESGRSSAASFLAEMMVGLRRPSGGTGQLLRSFTWLRWTLLPSC
ncbi:tetratricopeptide repeat protein [Streptomyces sp. NPDC055134]